MSLGQKFAQKLDAEWLTDKPLILPDVWDVASARILAEANFPVLTTSAASYAWAQGYRPGERVKLEELLIVAARIIRDTSLPLIADLEGCYDRSNQTIQKSTKAALSVGAKAVIIGDGGREGMHQMLGLMEVANRLKSARLAAIELGKPLTLIARTDTLDLGAIIANPIQEAIQRANTYLNAGADLVQVSGVQNIDVVAELSSKINGPIGIYVNHSGAPHISAYRDANITTISLGTGLMRSALTDLRGKADNLFKSGNFTHLDDVIPKAEFAELLSEPLAKKQSIAT